MNDLDVKLAIIKECKNIAEHQIKKEPDADKRVKIAKRIALYNRLEKEIIQELKGTVKKLQDEWGLNE